MKIIKEGKPYRIHKCSKCKTIYAYKIDRGVFSYKPHCPECGEFSDSHYFDKKISRETYKKLCGVEGNNE